MAYMAWSVRRLHCCIALLLLLLLLPLLTPATAATLLAPQCPHLVALVRYLAGRELGHLTGRACPAVGALAAALLCIAVATALAAGRARLVGAACGDQSEMWSALLLVEWCGMLQTRMMTAWHCRGGGV